jgi:pimeloyl-ACP methyl ester carboxylesterase
VTYLHVRKEPKCEADRKCEADSTNKGASLVDCLRNTATWPISFRSRTRCRLQLSFISADHQNMTSSEKVEVKDQQISLPNGISVQVLSAVPHHTSQLPPLVFLHGSLHGPWCWQEKFFPCFVLLGYPVMAYGRRGTSGTFAGEGVKKVKLADHVEDLHGILSDQLPAILGPEYGNRKPIVVSHSFGGIILMKYLETTCNKKPADLFSGIVTLSSVPPSGHGKMTKRLVWRSRSDAWKIIRGVPMKKATTDPLLCRELFFGGKLNVLADGAIDDHGVTDADLARYQAHMQNDSKVSVDMSDLSKHLPSKEVDREGRAPFVVDLPPVLVIGAKDDFMVDTPAFLETAKYFGLEEPVMVNSPHDSMLGRNWRNIAGTIHQWIQENVSKNKH